MRSIKDRVTSNTSLLNKSDQFSDQFRKSLESLSKTNQFIFFRNKTIYKPLKKPFMAFQDGLYFVHKSHKYRKSSSNSKSSSYKHSPKPTPVPKLYETVKIPSSSLSFTQNHRTGTPVVPKQAENSNEENKKPKSLSVAYKPVRPKIVIKRKKNKRCGKMSQTMNDGWKAEEFEGIHPWNYEASCAGE